jgi:hypothetical protein
MSEMETILHTALKRSPMPTALPLSGLVKWMHDRIKAHQDANTRWRQANPETAKICASNRYYRDKPLKTGLDPTMSLVERREAKAAYMRNYRAAIRLERAKMDRKIKTQNWDRWKAQKQAEAAKRRAKWLRRQRKRGLV